MSCRSHFLFVPNHERDWTKATRIERSTTRQLTLSRILFFLLVGVEMRYTMPIVCSLLFVSISSIKSLLRPTSAFVVTSSKHQRRSVSASQKTANARGCMTATTSRHYHAKHVADLTGKTTTLSPGFDVRRLLPQAKKRTVGSFCFVDHFGPVDLRATPAMDVGPHPHIGLATLTYLYEGAILHRDSTGAEKVITPGSVNYMITGKGIVHSERAKPETLAAYYDHDGTREQELPSSSHGLQLWLALPREREDVDPSFHAGQAVTVRNEPNLQVHLVVGNFGSQSVPDIPMDPAMGRVMFVDVCLTKIGTTFDLESEFIVDNASHEETEMGIYVVSGAVDVQTRGDEKGSFSSTALPQGVMSVWNLLSNNESANDSSILTITATRPDTRIAILGGTALPEPRHMMWNFVSHSSDKINRAAAAWKAMDRTVFPPVVGEDNLDSIPLPEKRNS